MANNFVPTAGHMGRAGDLAGVTMRAPTELASLLRATFIQANRLLRLATPLGAEVLLAEQLHAAEQLDGGGFRLELTALSDNAGIDPGTLIGQPVRLELLTQQSHSAEKSY